MSDKITGHTQLVAIFATPIGHSVSPIMHNAAFEELGIDARYLAFEVGKDKIGDAICGMRAMGFMGANISMPNKAAVIEHLDEVSEAAEMIGAVNTITNENGRLCGHNTDGIGFMMALADNDIDVIGKKITIGGCGGAATAIAVQAALDGVSEISIFNIRDDFYSSGEETARRISERTSCRAKMHDFADTEELRREIESSALLVNATGLGMPPLDGRTWLPDKSYLRSDLVVADTIYNPPETELLKMAREAGCRTMNGFGMVLFQGVAGFKLWTGRDMPVDKVKEVLGF